MPKWKCDVCGFETLFDTVNIGKGKAEWRKLCKEPNVNKSGPVTRCQNLKPIDPSK